MRLKIAVLAPTPIASVSTAMMVALGLFPHQAECVVKIVEHVLLPDPEKPKADAGNPQHSATRGRRQRIVRTQLGRLPHASWPLVAAVQGVLRSMTTSVRSKRL